MSFANMKRSKGSVANLVAAAEAVGGGGKKHGDDRLWKPTVDKVGNGFAVIRFLPAAEGNDLPWNRYWDHGFKGPGGQWYIEKSLTSIGAEDPVGEMNGLLWNSGRDEDKQLARDRKRRLHYVANILVVSDPGNPSNEGKTMLYAFGKKIFDKIMDSMQPEFADEDPINPFDFWEGADFKIKIRQVEGWRNYDKSEFASPKALPGSDEDLESLYNKLVDLREFTDVANYKTYDQLKEKLNRVLGTSAVMATKDSVSLANVQDEPTMPTAGDYNQNVPTSEPVTAEAVAEEDETLSYFAKLAQED